MINNVEVTFSADSGSFEERLEACHKIIAANMDTLVATFMAQTGHRAADIELVQNVGPSEITFSVRKKEA